MSEVYYCERCRKEVTVHGLLVVLIEFYELFHELIYKTDYKVDDFLSKNYKCCDEMVLRWKW